MKISTLLISRLRAETQASLVIIRKALQEHNNDYEKAKDHIAKLLVFKGEQRLGNIGDSGSEGVVAVAITPASAAMIELSCKTDFVAKNTAFVKFASDYASLLAREPEADESLIIENEYFGKCSISEALAVLSGKFGEPIRVRRRQHHALKQQIPYAYITAGYAHGGILVNTGKIAALITLKGENIPYETMFHSSQKIAALLARHVAGMNPSKISSDDTGDDSALLNQTLLGGSGGSVAEALLEESAKIDKTARVSIESMERWSLADHASSTVYKEG